jgi:hypothetical protein
MPFVVLSLDEMYKEVLGWDLYVMLSGRPMYQLRDVPERFSSVDEYLDVFEPLLLEECRAQTLRSLYEMTDSRDHHLQLKLVEPLEPFRLLHFESPNREGEKSLFFETDLVFVSHEPLDLDAVEEDANGETRTVPQQFHALAIVVNSTTSGTLMLKVYLPEDPTSRLPPSQHKRLQLLRKVMVPASGKWHVRKLGNMVTINREFQALYSLRELTLASMLLAPGSLDGSAPPPRLQKPPSLWPAIKATHNPSQLAAIRTCLCGRGVTLIQGPPGTGKTKTILGILSVLLASHSAHTLTKSERSSWRDVGEGGDGEGDDSGTAGGAGAAGSASAATGAPPPWPFALPPKRSPTEIAALLKKNAPWLSAEPAAAAPSATPSAAPSAAPSTAPAAAPAKKRVPAPPPLASLLGVGEDDSAGAQPSRAEGGADEVPLTCQMPLVELPPHPFPTAASTDRHVHLGRAVAEEPPKHVLVCAPSNAAIDEIVSRLLRHTGPGMLNARGESFLPYVVRVGPNVKESLIEVALETMAKKRMATLLEHGETISFDAAKTLVLNEASIVCTTLSCAGYSIFSQLKQGFDTVLIDEAAQAVEVSTLIPLKYACRRLILVGDPSQLPATVFSDHSMKHNYEQSLFQRLQIGGQRVAMLTTQYRMHPAISRFPGRRFYAGALLDAPGQSQLRRAAWHSQRWLGPYVFYDVSDGTASEVSSSWSNELEAQLALAIVRHLLNAYPDAIAPSSIGIISPYNGQVRYIRTLLKESFDEATARLIDVNSVDGFQGREKDIIVLSTVRSDLGQRGQRGIGFLRDARRMNVSITRARSSVFVLGHADTLAKDPLWEAVLQDATDRHCLVKALKPIGPWFEAARKEPERSAPDELDADQAGADGEATAEAASTVVVQRAPEVDTGAVSSPRGARAKRAAKSGRG